MRWVITWKDADSAVAPLPRIKARHVARGFEHQAQANGRLVNTARLALQGTNQDVMSAGSA